MRVHTYIIGSLILLFTLLLSSSSFAQVELSLKESIGYGLNNHSSIYIGKNKIEMANEKKRETLSAYLPQVNVSGTLDANLKVQSTYFPAIPITLPSGESFTMGGGAVAFGQKYNSSLSAQLDQQLYNQQILVGIKASEPNQRLAEQTFEQTRQNLIYNISYAYYQIIIAKKRIELLNENINRYKELLRVVNLREQQGVATKVNVSQTRLNLNNILSQLEVAKNTYQVALNSFKTNVGISQGTAVALTDTSRWLNKVPDEVFMPDFEYDNSIEKKLQQTQIELLHLNQESIKAEAFPSLSLYARYGFNGFGNKLGQAFDPLYNFSSVGLRVAWNPFTGFGRDARYKQANYEYKNAVESLKLNEQLQNLQFQNSKTQLLSAYNTIVVNRENLTLAKEVYDNTNLQYKQGVAQLSDLINVEMSMWTAQNNYIQSLLDYYIAELELNKSNGTLYQYYQNL